MRVVTTPVYQCDHCNKLYKRKNACATHEKRCASNPDNRRACFGCAFLKMVEETEYHDMWNGHEMENKIKVLKCTKKDVFVHPPIVEHKKNAKDWGEINEPMPRECDLFEMDLPF